MPILDDNCPAVLKTAINEMEQHVQNFKKGVAYRAPEMQDYDYIELQRNLASSMTTLYDKATRHEGK
jgi:hypothetical protein